MLDNTPPDPFTTASPEKRAQFCAALVNSIRHEETARALSDRELCERFLTEVWATLPMLGASEAIADELLARFEKQCGFVRDKETGEILP